ncbi:MAG: hypothetical protein LWW86_12580 [Micrococcales bacterium]|nr:hypothetical protein [Micrococcales bacterium]
MHLDQRLRELLAESPIEEVPAGSDHRCAGGTHSTLADGRRLCWAPRLAPGERVALDAEIAQQPVPSALARRWGSTDPAWVWPEWTVAEVVAKLTDTPILPLAARGHGAAYTHAGVGPGLTWLTGHRGDLVVTVGLRQGGPQA